MPVRLDKARGVLHWTEPQRRFWNGSSRRGGGAASGTAYVRREAPVDVDALRDEYAERAAIREYDGGEERAVAEREAWRDVSAAALHRAKRGG